MMVSRAAVRAAQVRPLNKMGKAGYEPDKCRNRHGAAAGRPTLFLTQFKIVDR